MCDEGGFLGGFDGGGCVRVRSCLVVTSSTHCEDVGGMLVIESGASWLGGVVMWAL
jgi:hypothetical protein